MASRRLLCLAAVAALTIPCRAAALPGCERLPSPSPPAGPRTAVFISDLHLGVGRDPADSSPNPRWHKMEDFRWHRELSDFLEWLNEKEKGTVDLVLLGDVLELWQSLSTRDCHHEGTDKKIGKDIGKNLGCTEDEAHARAQRAVDQHREVLDKLRWFAVQGENRVTIVPGNHDVALAFPRVRELLLGRIGAPAERLRIATEGYWWSADGTVVAEHGHQIGNDPNRFEGWPERPVIEHGGVTYLRQPWGEQMVQEVFNEREAIFPVLDNLSEEIHGLGLAWRAQKPREQLSSISKLARFVVLQTSWAQTRQGLGGDGSPGAVSKTTDFDLTALRQWPAEARERFLIDSLPREDPLRPVLEEERRAGRPVPGLGDLTEEEIRSLCAHRLIHNETAEGEKLSQCPTATGLGAAAQALADALLPGAKDKRFRDHLECLKDGLPVKQRPTRLFETYVYAHTHREEGGRSPFPATHAWTPEVWNDGAWQRRVTPEQFCTISRRKQPSAGKPLSADQALRQIAPEDLPACYSFVRARWTEERAAPSVSLLYWVQEAGQKGEAKPVCPFTVDAACDPAKKPAS